MSREYPCIYFEQDGVCRRFSDDTVLSYCVMGPCPEQKLSNTDRIRAMSDDDLAKFLTHTVSDGCPPNMDWECKKDEEGWDACDKCWGKWLQQPAEENT